MSLNPISKIFLICFCGFFLSLSAPSYDLWFIAWIGLSPFFIIINTSRKLKEAIIFSFLFGFSYNLSYLHWLFSLHPLNWLGFSNFKSLFISLLALVTTSVSSSLYFVLFAVCVFYLKQYSIRPHSKGISNLFLVTFIWLIIFNKLSSCKFLLGFPWTLVEYSQYKNLFLIQIAELFGSTAISFLIVLFNLIVANLFIWFFNIEKIGNRIVPKAPGQFGEIIISFSIVSILISLSLIFGFFSYKKNQQYFTNESKSVCVLQGDLPIKATRGGNLDIQLARKTYNDLINKNNAELFIAPEGSLPVIFNTDEITQHWLKTISKKKQADIILGSYCNKEDRLTNCTVGFSQSKNKFSFYEKERLVPFGEYVPFSFLLPGSLKKLALNAIGDGFKEGRGNLPLESFLGTIGANICFELIFPTIIRKHILQNASLLVNFSDLSWFSNDRIKKQFLSFAVFRAIENRRYVIIAANNGISAFIEPTGKIKSQSIPNSKGVLIDWINPINKITFYSKYGW